MQFYQKIRPTAPSRGCNSQPQNYSPLNTLLNLLYSTYSTHPTLLNLLCSTYPILVLYTHSISSNVQYAPHVAKPLSTHQGFELSRDGHLQEKGRQKKRLAQSD